MNQSAAVEQGNDLAAADRDVIGELANIIVPAGEGFPSATDVSVHLKWIDRGLKVRPDLQEPLISVVRLCAKESPEAVVARLVESEPELLEPVVELIVACYYMSPKVRKRLGYQGQVATPILSGEAEYYLRDDLLAGVAARAPMWRHTPDDLVNNDNGKDLN